MNYQYNDVIIMRINADDKTKLQQEAKKNKVKLSQYLRDVLIKDK